MTDKLVAELRELLAKATSGPWAHEEVMGAGGFHLVRDGITAPNSEVCHDVGNSDDAALIVAAVNALPALLDALTPKESALIKPPREVSGDAVGGGTSEVVFGIPMMFYDSSDRTRRMLALADLIDNNPDHHSFSVNGAATLSADLRALAYTPKARPTASDGAERAWREGWALCKASLTDDEAFCLTVDVEQDAWLDSKTRHASPPTTDASERMREALHGHLAVAIAFLARGPGGTNASSVQKWADLCADVNTELVKADNLILAAGAEALGIRAQGDG